MKERYNRKIRLSGLQRGLIYIGIGLGFTLWNFMGGTPVDAPSSFMLKRGLALLLLLVALTAIIFRGIKMRNRQKGQD